MNEKLLAWLDWLEQYLADTCAPIAAIAGNAIAELRAMCKEPTRLTEYKYCADCGGKIPGDSFCNCEKKRTVTREIVLTILRNIETWEKEDWGTMTWGEYVISKLAELGLEVK